VVVTLFLAIYAAVLSTYSFLFSHNHRRLRSRLDKLEDRMDDLADQQPEPEWPNEEAD
jgi:hypothetical protein